MQLDRPFFGILLMLAFCVLAPFGDSLAKLLGARIPLLELIFVRFGIQTVLLVPIVLVSGKSLWMARRTFRLTVVRTLLHLVGSAAMYMSLRYLPIADAIAIAFVMPFIMLILGKTVLDEDIGSRRIAACGVGFVGTLLVVQPSFANVGAPALLPLLVAVVFALFMLVTRQIAKDADPITLQATSGLVATPVLGALILIGQIFDAPETGLIMPAPSDLLLLLMIGIVGTVAHLLMTGSLRYAPSATLAPMQYLEIPFATILGWLIFNDLPNGLAAVGIAITISAGLYIIYREQKIAPGAAPLA
jgi:drug/metabolite transporter (DMT)-like permease